MKLRLAFHTPKGEEFFGVGGVIVNWTWILALAYNWKALKYNYSHVELWIPDENGNFSCNEPFIHPGNDSNQVDSSLLSSSYSVCYLGECFSSTTRGGSKGVRFAPASEVIGKHPDRWHYIEFEVFDEVFKAAYEDMKKMVGALYDFIGVIISFIFPIRIQDNSKWWCSEIVMFYVYFMRAIRKWYKRISPRRTALVMAKKYHEPIPLAK